jgi:nucleoside-diphosphate-sugar epimerase
MHRQRSLSIRSSYNLAGISFTPTQLAEQIKQTLPSFEISYADNDPRQAIADSWPKSIDDSQAQQDWGWQLEYDLPKMTQDMLENLKRRFKINKLYLTCFWQTRV